MRFRDVLEHLERKGLLVRISNAVSAKLEAARIAKANMERTVLFERVKGAELPLAVNVFRSREILAELLGTSVLKLKHRLLRAIKRARPVRLSKPPVYRSLGADLRRLPIPWHYRADGGPYITAGVVVAHHPRWGTNLSYHRMLVKGRKRLVLRVLPRHLNHMLENGLERAVVAIGNQPQVAVAAAVSVELGRSELDIANALRPVHAFELWQQPVPEAEVLLLVEFSGETAREGPFVDITGTVDIVREQPVAKVQEILVRPGAVYHSIIPAGPEHRLLMGMPKEPVIMEEVNKVCRCLDVYVTPGGCSWLHAIIKIAKRRPADGRRAIAAAFRAHRSLKHVWVVDADIDIYDSEQVEWAMATRFQGSKDMVVKREPGSSLDPSADQRTGKTTKIGFDLTVPTGAPAQAFRRAH
jgi:UbiD family decarboxylase